MGWPLSKAKEVLPKLLPLTLGLLLADVGGVVVVRLIQHGSVRWAVALGLGVAALIIYSLCVMLILLTFLNAWVRVRVRGHRDGCILTQDGRKGYG